MVNKNIFITGGAGDIDKNPCNEPSSRGCNVIACDLYNTKRDDFISCDMCSMCNK